MWQRQNLLADRWATSKGFRSYQVLSQMGILFICPWSPARPLVVSRLLCASKSLFELLFFPERAPLACREFMHHVQSITSLFLMTRTW